MLNADDGNTAALRVLKMCFDDNKVNSQGLIDAVKDAAKTDNQFNREFLNTVLAFALEGWKNA